jgi:hypothetical protein
MHDSVGASGSEELTPADRKRADADSRTPLPKASVRPYAKYYGYPEGRVAVPSRLMPNLAAPSGSPNTVSITALTVATSNGSAAQASRPSAGSR